VDRLRRWAIFGNVDAVVWIDYAKANQPPGSFKMGPRDSRPFSQAHMELCLDDHDDERDNANGDGDSEAAWSDMEEEAGERGAAAPRETLHHTQPPKDLSLSEGSRTSIVLQRGHSAGSVPLKRLVRASELAEQKAQILSARESSKTSRERDASQPQSARAMQENFLLRTMLQEEIVPGHGSIYTRSIAPGPGYYGTPGSPTLEEAGVGEFGHRPKGRIDGIMDYERDKPGPGQYSPRAPELEEKLRLNSDDPRLPKPQLGSIGKMPRLVPANETSRRLPFISAQASKCEGYGSHSPPVFYAIESDAPCNSYIKPPKYSFGKMKRPF
jgi:hypothetical protein